MNQCFLSLVLTFKEEAIGEYEIFTISSQWMVTFFPNQLICSMDSLLYIIWCLVYNSKVFIPPKNKNSPNSANKTLINFIILTRIDTIFK